MTKDGGSTWNMKFGGLSGDSIYNRLPFGLAMPLGLIVGGIYIVVLPVILAATAVYAVGLKILGGFMTPVRKSVSFGWRPTEAYLAGKNKKDAKGAKDGGKAE